MTLAVPARGSPRRLVPKALAVEKASKADHREVEAAMVAGRNGRGAGCVDSELCTTPEWEPIGDDFDVAVIDLLRVDVEVTQGQWPLLHGKPRQQLGASCAGATERVIETAAATGCSVEPQQGRAVRRLEANGPDCIKAREVQSSAARGWPAKRSSTALARQGLQGERGAAREARGMAVGSRF